MHQALDDNAFFPEHRFEQLLGFTRLEVVQTGAPLRGARAGCQVNVSQPLEELLGKSADDLVAARAQVGFREPAGHHAADEARGLEHHRGLAGARGRHRRRDSGRRRTENHDLRRYDVEHVLGGCQPRAVRFAHLRAEAMQAWAERGVVDPAVGRAYEARLGGGAVHGAGDAFPGIERF